MPVVSIETWPLDEKVKPIIIKKITDVFSEMGVSSQAVTIIIHEVDLDNWGTAGEQHSIKFKDLKR